MQEIQQASSFLRITRIKGSNLEKTQFYRILVTIPPLLGNEMVYRVGQGGFITAPRDHMLSNKSHQNRIKLKALFRTN